MPRCSLIFYEIKSRKSEISQSGVRQISLACEDHPDVFCFLWIDTDQQLQYVQFVFQELVLEWNGVHGVRCSQTNRMQERDDKIGIRKGSRSLHILDDPELFTQTMRRLTECEFPEEWDSMIRNKFVF